MPSDKITPEARFATTCQAYANAYVSLRDAYIELAKLHAARLEQPDYWLPMCNSISDTLRRRLVKAGIDYNTATLLAYPPSDE